MSNATTLNNVDNPGYGTGTVVACLCFLMHSGMVERKGSRYCATPKAAKEYNEIDDARGVNAACRRAIRMAYDNICDDFDPAAEIRELTKAFGPCDMGDVLGDNAIAALGDSAVIGAIKRRLNGNEHDLDIERAALEEVCEVLARVLKDELSKRATSQRN